VPTDVASREVSACAVYLHIAPTLIQVGDWPLAGTPGWTAFDDDDPRKQAALLHAALQWALAEDIRQNAIAQARADVWMSGDLRGVPEQIKTRKKAIADGTYIPRRSA
jgi:hypothetical protein